MVTPVGCAGDKQHRLIRDRQSWLILRQPRSECDRRVDPWVTDASDNRPPSEGVPDEDDAIDSPLRVRHDCGQIHCSTGFLAIPSLGSGSGDADRCTGERTDRNMCPAESPQKFRLESARLAL